MSTRLATMLQTAVGTALMAACAGEAAEPPDLMGRFRGRLILTLVDLSASVPAAALDAPLTRLASEARAGDRLVVLPISDRVAEPPIIDTLIAGAVADRISGTLGLSTRDSRRHEHARAVSLARDLRQVVREARRTRGASPRTAIIDALCQAAMTAADHPGTRVVAVALTDGREDSRWGSLERSAPTLTSAARLSHLVREARGCPLGQPNLRLRIVGVSHTSDTPALVQWWRSLVTALGYHPLSEDVSAHPLGSLLGEVPRAGATVRDPRGMSLTPDFAEYAA